MHLGQVANRDLIKWDYLDVELAPGEFYDKGGCFSGTSIVDAGKIHLLYTEEQMISDKVSDCKQV